MSTRPGTNRAAAAAVGLAQLAQVAWPWLQRGASLALLSVVTLARLAYRHRGALMAVGHRVAWWSALVLLVVGSRPVLGSGPIPERELAIAPFAVGLVLCAVLRVVVARRHLRLAALGLGAMHGTALVLVWTAFGS